MKARQPIRHEFIQNRLVLRFCNSATEKSCGAAAAVGFCAHVDAWLLPTQHQDQSNCKHTPQGYAVQLPTLNLQAEVQKSAVLNPYVGTVSLCKSPCKLLNNVVLPALLMPTNSSVSCVGRLGRHTPKIRCHTVSCMCSVCVISQETLSTAITRWTSGA
jgi:hypothetical protein